MADEVSLLVREQPFTVRRLIGRSRRLAAGLPTVWQAFGVGEVGAEHVRVIDRVARRVTEEHTLAVIDDQVVAAAQTRCPKQLAVWLLRLVVGEPIDEPPPMTSSPRPAPHIVNRRSPLRIGIVVPLSSLLGAGECPGELADRSGVVPAQVLRRLITEALGAEGDRRDRVLFSRLLTDDGGRLLDVTELGRFPSDRLAQAIKIRAGTCRYPTCTVPAGRCDLDHHEPVPRGPTSGADLDPLCRRHHRGKTFAWLASIRDHHGVDWTMPDAEHYRCMDDPLPTGLAA